MKTYDVMIPFAGHLSIQVEAKDEKDAIQVAMDEATLEHVESWEALEQFNQGNICYCPSPWEAEATLAAGEDDAE